MRYLITLFIFFSWFQCFGQTLFPSDTDTTKPSITHPPSPTYRDFDYSFYPVALYQLYESEQGVIDTVAKRVQVKITKAGDQFAIIGPTGQTIFQRSVIFDSIAQDGSNTFYYRAGDQNKEIIAVNQVFGFAVLLIKRCEGKDCDWLVHAFGAVPIMAFIQK